MLLHGYSTTIKQAAACKPGPRPLYCVAALHNDIGAVLPYLNRVLGGIGYLEKPPAMLLEHKGRQIALSAKEITISPVTDATDADEILGWLQGEINTTWEKRMEITPSFHGVKPPTVLEILRLLPRSNCGKCGQPSCTAFAAQLVAGASQPGECLPLSTEERLLLKKSLT